MSGAHPSPPAASPPRATLWLAAALALAAGLLALALACDNFQARLDSDLLWPQVFLRDLHDPLHPVSGWNFGSATFWFPDYATFLPLYWLCGNSGLGYPLYITFHFLLIGATMAWALAAAGVEWRKAAVAGFLVVDAVLLTQGLAGQETWLWRLAIPCDHGGNVPLGFAVLALALGTMRAGKWSRGRSIAFIILAALGLAADALTLVHWLAPMGIALAWQALRARELRPVGRGFFWRAGMALAFAVAVRLIFSLTQTFFFSNFLQYNPTPQNMWKSFSHFADEFFHGGIFTDNWASWLLAAAGVAAAMAALRKSGNTETEPVKRVAYTAGLLSLLFAWVAPFATVYWINEHSIRYLLNWLMLPGWLLALRVCSQPALPRWLPKLAAVTALAAIAFAVPLIKTGALFFPDPPEAEKLREFLTRNNLREGLADFWHTHLLAVEWRFEGPRIGNIADDFFPCFWCNNAFDYFPVADNGRGLAPPAPQFILLDGLDPERVLPYFGADAARVAHVAGYTVVLLTPEQTKRAGERIAAQAKNLLQGRRAQWLETKLPPP